MHVHIYHKHVHVPLTKQAKNHFFTMESTVTQILLFHKRSVYPFPGVQILNPYHVEFLLVLCVCREGAVLMLLFFL